jgi:hypothetical protein
VTLKGSRAPWALDPKGPDLRHLAMAQRRRRWQRGLPFGQQNGDAVLNRRDDNRILDGFEVNWLLFWGIGAVRTLTGTPKVGSLFGEQVRNPQMQTLFRAIGSRIICARTFQEFSIHKQRMLCGGACSVAMLTNLLRVSMQSRFWQSEQCFMKFYC